MAIEVNVTELRATLARTLWAIRHPVQTVSQVAWVARHPGLALRRWTADARRKEAQRLRASVPGLLERAEWLEKMAEENRL